MNVGLAGKRFGFCKLVQFDEAAREIHLRVGPLRMFIADLWLRRATGRPVREPPCPLGSHGVAALPSSPRIREELRMLQQKLVQLAKADKAAFNRVKQFVTQQHARVCTGKPSGAKR